jgi:hypothetical protein
MGLKKQFNETVFRMKIRKALSDETNEYIKITYEEAKKMCEKRKIKL